MSTGTGKAKVPGGQSTGSPAEALHQDYTKGAKHETIRDSLVGSRGSEAGQALSVTASNQRFGAAFTGTMVLITTNSTDDIFYEIGENPTAIVDTSTHLPSNRDRYEPINTGDEINIIGTGTNGKVWCRPVALI